MEEARALQETAQVAFEHNEALLATAVAEILEAKQFEAEMLAETAQLEATLAGAELAAGGDRARAEETAWCEVEAQTAEMQQMREEMEEMRTQLARARAEASEME